jgi:NAD-dependent deacetylase
MTRTDLGIPSEAVERLKGSFRIAVLTGAGVSAESGVPTFRDREGLWKEYRAEQLATPQAFAADPDLVWEWYHWRRDTIRKVFPNRAHRSLVDLEDRIDHFTLITQNVDGLHIRAGSRNVLQIHGNIHHARCLTCSAGLPLSDERGFVRCPECGSGMRPDVVWFGENLDPVQLRSAFAASQEADFFLVAGTSVVVQPAATLVHTALKNSAYVLEVNLDPTPLTGSVNATVLGKAGDILPELVRLAWDRDKSKGQGPMPKGNRLY